MKTYKFYSDKSLKEFWQQYWSRVKEDSDSIIDYTNYPFSSLKKYSKKDSKILEIGCGTGRVLKGLYNEGYNVLGFDFDFSSLMSINQRKKYPVFLADILNIPVKDNSFDLALCFGVINSIEDEKSRVNILINIKKILKKDGIFIISLINYNLLRKMQRYLFSLRNIFKPHKHFYCWAASVSTLSSFLSEHFDVISKNPGRSRQPLWYYAPFLRGARDVDEKIARVDDKQYKLNFLGEGLFQLFNFLCPYAICGGTVFVCKNSK